MKKFKYRFINTNGVLVLLVATFLGCYGFMKRDPSDKMYLFYLASTILMISACCFVILREALRYELVIDESKITFCDFFYSVRIVHLNRIESFVFIKEGRFPRIEITSEGKQYYIPVKFLIPKDVKVIVHALEEVQKLK